MSTIQLLPLTDVSVECCTPLDSDTLSVEDADLLSSRLKAVADPARLRLVSLVAAHANAEACVCDLTEPLGLSQGTVSHHLKILVEAGIFAREKRGTWAYYSLIPGALGSLSAALLVVGEK
ncbi:metalloregulator ArsR/SmtB family transcription factor [Herbiconiux sp.]|jgi:ArsR family transcriptional regulator|uniref:ArsR/SmtB family transcription factor n=1 Tax=Herbiconiux sp. TaxID=1871186 RepID=UPI0025C07274|nr:metalloregulator ArsR/SmtB family transcription factor [Herbiconiux sp.]